MRKHNTKPNKTSYKKGHKKHPKSFGKGSKMPESAKETLRQIRLGKTGKLTPNWKGGLTDLTRCIHSLDKYKEWRLAIFIRDNWTCQNCKKIGVYLEPHHIKSLKVIIKENNLVNSDNAIKCKELWDINNGITLCKDCHKLTDNYAGKSHKK